MRRFKANVNRQYGPAMKVSETERMGERAEGGKEGW